MNIQKLMAEAQKIQKSMQKKLGEYDLQEFDFDYKGLVQIKIKGDLEITNVVINKDVVDPDDIDTLQDVVQTAINQAIREVTSGKNELSKKIAGPATAGMF